jgi:hypothetical protein
VAVDAVKKKGNKTAPPKRYKPAQILHWHVMSAAFFLWRRR